MKLSELINNIDKSNRHAVDIDDDLISDLGISTNFCIWIEQERFVSYYMGNWYCTDTWVGWQAYFLDDKFVGYTYQPGRKSDEVWKWLSKEAFDTVKEYVKSLIVEDEDQIDIIPDFDEDIGGGYRISFCGQLLKHHHNKALLNGIAVEIIEESEGYTASKVKIKHLNGKENWIELKNLLFRWEVKP